MNTIEQRPWGSFEVLAEGNGYKVKKIIVNPGQRLSLQSHKVRGEVWGITQGTGIFETGKDDQPNKLYRISEKDSIAIGTNQKHRLINDGKYPLIVIETQLGICDESDIIRYEDDYGRVEAKQ